MQTIMGVVAYMLAVRGAMAQKAHGVKRKRGRTKGVKNGEGMDKATRDREFMERVHANGLCSGCKTRKPPEGKRTCTRCTDRRKGKRKHDRNLRVHGGGESKGGGDGAASGGGQAPGGEFQDDTKRKAADIAVHGSPTL